MAYGNERSKYRPGKVMEKDTMILVRETLEKLNNPSLIPSDVIKDLIEYVRQMKK